MNRSQADQAFEQSFDDLARLAHRVAYRLVGSRSEAEDIAQEAMVRAFVRWRRISGHADPWVARVATNLALDALRRRSRHPIVTRPVNSEHSEASSGPDPRTLDRMELGRLLADLPRRQREVVALRYLADRSEADTAADLGTSVGTVKQHAHRGLAALRTAWSALDADPTLPPVRYDRQPTNDALPSATTDPGGP